MDSEDRLSEVFQALADPTRRQILQRLTQGDATVGDLAAGFAMTQPAISQHLKVLERAGLISRTRQGTARPSHLEGAPLREATTWLAGYRAYWEESFERLDQLLASLLKDGNGRDANRRDGNRRDGKQDGDRWRAPRMGPAGKE